jgi:hypothetical protein
MLLIGVILAFAIFGNILGRIFLPVDIFLSVRAWMVGTIVTVGLSCAGIYYPDVSGFRPLMYEGRGMMLVPLSVVFGLIAMFREGFEQRVQKKVEAATGLPLL